MRTSSVHRNRFARHLLCWTSVLAFAAPSGADVLFIGSDGNWFDPGNWSSGLVPDAATDVRLDAGVQVYIAPALGSPIVDVHDVTITGSARLDTLPGTVLTSNAMWITDGGFLAAQSSQFFGDSLNVEPAGGLEPGILLNPTTNDKRMIKIVGNSASSVTLGLGGLLAAGPGSVGPGHYATLRGDDVELDVPLDLELLYGFTPTPGDVFDIVEARNSLTGMFAGLPEGSLVERFGDVGLYISYQAGDGNDIALTAAFVPEPGALGLLLIGGLLLRRR